MKQTAFEVTIPEALELDQAFQLVAGQRCSLVLSNASPLGCEVDLYRSKTYMGTWRLEGSSSILITEEVLSAGALTFDKPEPMDLRIRADSGSELNESEKDLTIGFRIVVATAAGEMVHPTTQASIAVRIGAKALDLMIFSIPMVMMAETRGGEKYGMIWMGVAAIANMALIVKAGQTLGKRICKIRLANYENDHIPSWVNSIVLRAIVPGIICIVPGVGFIFALSDLISLGRKDQRCLHDLMAGTRVIRA